ncbi:MAG: hypothetical protein M3N18_06505 [Actinomycetota bacterium]|nr:hypothetical protein [Actinomycetota bacterium]
MSRGPSASAHEEHGLRTAVHLDGTVEITVVATKTKATVFNYVVLNYE